MRFIFEKNRILSSVYLQITIIILIFLTVIVSVFLFNRANEIKHLENSVRSAFALAESKVTSGISESETFLINFSDTIRSMILQANNRNNDNLVQELQDYMSNTTDNIINNERLSLAILNAYGYFFIQDGIFLSGTGLEHIEDYEPAEMFWFDSSINNSMGDIVISNPYNNPVHRSNVITLSYNITDDNGSPLGIICIDVDIINIYNDIVYINLTPHSYGLLINKNLYIYAHPTYYLTGNSLDTADFNIANLAEENIKGRNIFRQKTRNYLYESVYVFFHNMKYDLTLCIVIPVNEYNSNINNSLVFITIVCGILAAVLCVLMYQIAQEKKKSDLRNKQKSNFLATMSHEIRTPLNAIIGMTEIEMQINTHPASVIEAFGKINHSGNILLNIINDILDLSKIEAGKLELTPVKYETASLINDVIQLNYIRYEYKPIEFIVNVDENIPLALFGDELRIKQILNNLLSNAFKYTDKGEVKFFASSECVGKGGIILVTLIFKIIDTGHGMSQEQLNKLYDEYSRFNMEANRTTEGSGLGMAITQNLVNLMQGRITIKSEVGAGTEITVRIPQRTDGVGVRGFIGKELAESFKQFRNGNAIKTRRIQMNYEYMPYGSVLIVDDVETNLYVAKGLMTPYGLKIDLAASGLEAIEKIKDGNVYDIIFMDHMMPKLDGIESAKIIRDTGYTNPIVALTANALTGHEEMFIKNGFDGYIAKPIDIRQLNVILNKLIRDKQPAEVIEAAQKKKIEYDKKHAPLEKNIDNWLAPVFAKDAEKAHAVLESILQNNFKDENDLKSYIINIHALKSALANVGEAELSAIASKLEQAGRDNNINAIVSDTKPFLKNLREVIEKIKPKDDSIEAQDTEEIRDLLREKYEIILNACKSYDKKTIKTILSELMEKTRAQNTRKILTTINEHLLHSEFDDIEKLVLQAKSVL